MKRILYLASRYPATYAGREYMLKQNLNFIKQEQYLVDYVYFGGGNNVESKDGINFIELTKPSIAEIAFNFFAKKNLSLQERLFYSRKAKQEIFNLHSKNKYDIILVDMVRMAYLAENIDCYKILEYDDLLSLRYRRMVENYDKNIDVLGTYSEKYPRIFVKAIRPFAKLLLEYESYKIEEREIALSKVFNKLSFTSPLEAGNFKVKSGNIEVFANPPAIAEIKTTERPAQKLNDNKFIFVGNLKANHNLATLKEIVKIFGNKDVLKSKAKVDIYGDYDSRALNMCAAMNNIELHGMVESISTAYQGAACLIAPIPFGSGIKVKVIEAMSYNVPVMTNLIGAEGIGLVDGVTFVQCYNELDFVKKIVEVQNGKLLLDDISIAGRLYVLNSFSEKIVKETFISSLSN